MADAYPVVVAAGDMRSLRPDALETAHEWTPNGVTIESGFTGAHLLHVATNRLPT